MQLLPRANPDATVASSQAVAAGGRQAAAQRPLHLALGRLRPSGTAMLLIALSFPTSEVRGADATPVQPLVRLKAICSTSLFHGVDRAEVQSSGNLWLQSVGKHIGLSLDSAVELADSVAEMRRRIDEGAVDVVVSSALEYLAIDRANLLPPVATLAAGNTGSGRLQYLLLVNTGSGIARLEDLKEKSVISYSRSDANLTRLWLETALHDQHLPQADQHFRSFSTSVKPSAACLPVFFGKANACLIDDASWEVLRELNPQLGTKLKIIEQSPPLVETVISMLAKKREHRAEIIKGILDLQNDPEGKQILLFFKCRRTAGIEGSDLAPVANLRSAYLRFTAPGDRKISVLAGVGSAAESVKAH